MLRPAEGTSEDPTEARAHGPEEFSAHFSQSFRVLWLIAAGILGDRSLADDVLQEAAMIALAKFDQFTPGTSFAAWMGQVVRHVSLNMSRKERRRRPMGSLEALETSDRGEATLSKSEENRAASVSLSATGRLPDNQPHFDDRVMAALGRLGEVPRACLLLRTIEDLDYSEISRLLEIPEGTAMSHVHRARKFLFDNLGPSMGLRSGPEAVSQARGKGGAQPS